MLRDFAKVPPLFWIVDAPVLKESGGERAIFLAQYLLTAPTSNMYGVYYLPITLFAHNFGWGIDGASMALHGVIDGGFATYDFDLEYVWVHKMGVQQVEEQLKPKDTRIVSCQKFYDHLPNLIFLEEYFDFYCSRFHLQNKRKNSIPKVPHRCPIYAPSMQGEGEGEGEGEEKENHILSNSAENADQKKFEAKEKAKQKREELENQAKEVIDFLNVKRAMMVQGVRGFGYEPSNLKFIIARLNEGADVRICRKVIAIQFNEWLAKPEMHQYFRPSTLFNADKFNQYKAKILNFTE